MLPDAAHRAVPAAGNLLRIRAALCLSGFVALLVTSQLLPITAGAETYEVANYTGLPVYPYIDKAAMDKVSQTDTLGHWCSRFAAESPYPLDKVEAWYRTALVSASETDLTNDEKYKIYTQLAGIKLAIGIDYVTVFRAANGAPTSIELYRCSPPR